MKLRAEASKVGDAGRLEVGFYTSLAGPIRDILSVFARQHAQLDINIIEDRRSTLLPLLESGAVDVAVMLGDAAYREYAHKFLWSERVMVALPKTHKLAQSDCVYWTDLKNERFIMSQYDPGPEIQDVLLNKLSSPGSRLTCSPSCPRL
jgi:DNA-binding transcriptional LysR family regulator